jgi:hypothetical protein
MMSWHDLPNREMLQWGRGDQAAEDRLRRKVLFSDSFRLPLRAVGIGDLLVAISLMPLAAESVLAPRLPLRERDANHEQSVFPEFSKSFSAVSCRPARFTITALAGPFGMHYRPGCRIGIVAEIGSNARLPNAELRGPLQATITTSRAL